MPKINLFNLFTNKSSSLKASELSQNGKFGVYGAQGILGYKDTYQTDVKSLAIIKDGAGIGRVQIIPENSSVIGTMQLLIPNENTDLFYTYYLLKYLDLGKSYSGATIPHIYFKNYGKREIEYRSLAEQEHIGEELSSIDLLISRAKNSIQSLETLIKSRFNEMFGDPQTNPFGFKLSRFDSLGMLARGKSKHRPRNDPRLLGGKYPLIQTGDVAGSGLYITKYSSTYSEFGLAQSKMWPKGTLCITIAANIADSSILSFDACFPDSVVGFTPNAHNSVVFVKYQLEALKTYLNTQATSVAQKNLNLEKLSACPFMEPPAELQNQFASFVDLIDKLKYIILHTTYAI